MKTKSVFAAAVVVVLASAPMAIACEQHENIRQSCAADHIWDTDQGTCVPNPAA